MVRRLNEAFEQGLDMFDKACKKVYGAEWDKKSDKEKRDIIMSFIETAAKNGLDAKNGKEKKESRSMKVRSTSGRHMTEAVGDSFVEFGTHELTQYLPKEIIDDLNTKVSMMYEIMKLVNDNDIVGEHDTKLYKLFNIDFDEIEYDVTDDTIRWFLENAWEELEAYASELGVEMDVRDGRNSPYITFNTAFLKALSYISGDHLPVTIDEVWDAVMESVLGGSYRASFTDDAILNQEIEQELNDGYDRMNDAEDAVEVAEDLLYDVLEVPVSALSEIIDELNACIQVINYIDDFKDNADDYFLTYLQ